MSTDRSAEALRARILSLVSIDARSDDSCWVWQFTISRKGYAYLYGNGAHRTSYEVFVGPIPDGLTVDHVCHSRDDSCPGGNTCPHRRCVNPAHLEPVTAHENTLRSPVSFAAVNARKTHCVRGHEFTDENTYLYRGRRGCRTCIYARVNAWNRAKRASRSASRRAA